MTIPEPRGEMTSSTASEGAPQVTLTRQAARTPRAAAVAGIVFALLLITALVLVRTAVPATERDAGSWLTDRTHRNSVLLALTLVPFAGIAFLWFIGVVRDRIGDAEDRLFATVFLGSGLLFVGMLFVSAAAAAGLVTAVQVDPKSAATNETWRFGREVTQSVLVVYGMRMAGVFTISTSTILLRTRVMPRWLALSGYVVAVVLLLTVGSFAWVELLFPVWVRVLAHY